ncbi:V-type H+-transporting ATPase subunit F [Nematocida displodere]|uniref:V-type H+-transporting ATPase subunit F n=1 Tax=Nematocida displodere TaxID=1805483 RepID=A0A177EC19_9MICR|nr:V-type H+-transporting ATPase subunit F [Nematocida displodere]
MSFNGLSDRTKVAVLADEATVNGFRLTGINGKEWSQSPHGVFNYLHTVTDSTEDKDILAHFKILQERKEIAMIFLNRRASDVLREEIEQRKEVFPIIMDIPSKNTPPSGQDVKLMKRLSALTGNTTTKR